MFVILISIYRILSVNTVLCRVILRNSNKNSVLSLKHEGKSSLFCAGHHCPGGKLVGKGLNWTLLKNFRCSKGHLCWIIFRPVTIALEGWSAMVFINTCHSDMQKSFQVTRIGFSTKHYNVESLFWPCPPLVSSPWEKMDSICIPQCTLISCWPLKKYILKLFPLL